MAEPEGIRKSVHVVEIASVPKDGTPITVRFLAGYLGLMTHYNGHRTIPCFGRERCPKSLHALREIWKGYAPAELWEGSLRVWIACVVEITECLEHVLTGRDLRGQVWILSRRKKGKGGVVEGLYSQTDADETVREAFSILPVLERFYHEPELPLGCSNPVPPRIYLPTAHGQTPKLLSELAAPNPEEQEATPEQRERFRQQLREATMRDRSASSSTTRPSSSASSTSNGKAGGK